MAITSATVAITSAIHIAIVISDITKTYKKWSYINMTTTSVTTMWFHLPQWYNISHNKGHHHSDITSVTKTTSIGQNVVLTFDTTIKNWQ